MAMPQSGRRPQHQTEKNSVRAYVFGFTLSTGHCSAPSALRICANSGSKACDAQLLRLKHASFLCF
jgi:hypothetical protein